MQESIFDLLYPKYKIDKPIRLISLFSGYDSQALALKYLGVDFEHWKTCEWAIKSIQALKDLHFSQDNNDYSLTLDIDEIKKWLFEKGISSNWNEPLTKKQIDRMSEQYARQVFNNIIATRNLVNIQTVRGKDLQIKETDKFCYIMTYSFPCQDISQAGNRKGFSDTSTRSGMLWEVERVLTELEEKPQILLMENVPQVHSQDNIKDFQKWQLRLEEMGYKNYTQDLIATDYGIPQIRNRCFMVSILGEYNYTFPKPIPLKLKLKDLLEDQVDEKYFLSDKMIKYIFSEDDKYKVNKNSLKLNREIACSKTTREGWTRADTSDYIIENEKNCKKVADLNYWNHEQSNRVYSADGLCPTIRTKHDDAGVIKIKNATEQGYIEAEEGDGVDIGTLINEPKIIDDRDVGINGITINENCPTQRATRNGLKVLQSDLKIRKLTPKECFRLMGVKDDDFEKIKKNQSDSTLYHLAGDSIVVNVLMAVFKELL